MKKTHAILLATVAFFSVAKAQTDFIADVDHIGINVPDKAKGLAFFRDIMGYTPVTALGPTKLSSDWKKRFNIHQNAALNDIIMLRTGNGSSIELFIYSSPQKNTGFPAGDDAGWTHIAFNVEDINSSVAYLKSKGIRFLSDPITMTTGPTAGQSWVYFLSPWGSQMELVSYPRDKTSGKDAAITETQLPSLASKHLSIWSERDLPKRQELINQVYDPELQIIDPSFLLKGYQGLNKLINELQQKFPDYYFSVLTPAEGHHNVGRLSWRFGPASNPAAITGQDVFVLENGKIKTLYVFIDGDKK